jgi:PAS domain S-box-containing protein/putative nucleotidyltransferase with HDIG domain
MANFLTQSNQAVRFSPSTFADTRTPAHYPDIESQYQALFNAMVEGALLHGERGQILAMNPAAERVLGLSASEAAEYGTSVPWPIVSEDGSSLLRENQPWMVTLRTGQSQSNVVMGVRRADGRLVWMTANSQPLFASGSASCHAVMTVFQDITQQRLEQDALWQDENHLRRVNRALQTLSAGNETLVRAVSEQELLENMCQTMVDVGGHVLASIGEVAQEGMAIESRAWSGPSDAVLRKSICTKRCRPMMLALERGEPIVVHDIASDPRCSGCDARLNSYAIRSSLILPLQSEGVTLGVLSIHSANHAAFDDDEVVLMTKLGDDLSYGIRALRNRLDREADARRLQATMEETIQALASTVEFRDPYTAGHQRRVAQLATAIAREIGVTEDRITGLYLAAVIHDIGKIKVPAQVLIRPGRLSDIEFELVKTHVEVGYDILKSIDFPWPIATIVRQHHERMDGSGYPLGVDSTELLLESRILAVADVVEAISSFRPYRPGLGFGHALEEIEAGRGKLYDNDVVDACIRVISELNFSFDRQAVVK